MALNLLRGFGRSNILQVHPQDQTAQTRQTVETAQRRDRSQPFHANEAQQLKVAEKEDGAGGKAPNTAADPRRVAFRQDCQL